MTKCLCVTTDHVAAQLCNNLSVALNSCSCHFHIHRVTIQLPAQRFSYPAPPPALSSTRTRTHSSASSLTHPENAGTCNPRKTLVPMRLLVVMKNDGHINCNKPVA